MWKNGIKGRKMGGRRTGEAFVKTLRDGDRGKEETEEEQELIKSNLCNALGHGNSNKQL